MNVDELKEYQILNDAGFSIRASELFQLLANTIRGDTHMYLDMGIIKPQADMYLKHLYLLNRFVALRTLLQSKLSCDENGFHIDDHTFETLDDVYKAWKNKTFL